MDKLTFKKWLQLDEVGTSTGDVAHFSLPIGGMVTRNFPQFYSVGDHGLGGPVLNLTDTDYIVKPKRRKHHKSRKV